MKPVLGVCIFVLVVLFVFSPNQPAFGQQEPLPQLEITIQAASPAPFSFGIYTTLPYFPIVLSIFIRNLSKVDFPGGNVTGSITPPSGRYAHAVTLTVPKLSPGESKTFEYDGFKPLESGVYTVYLDTIQTIYPPWTVSDGFYVIEVEPASTLIEFWSIMIVLAVGLLSIATPIYREQRRTRRLEESRRVAAYRLLRGFVMGIEGRSAIPQGRTRLERVYLTQQDLDRINQVIADYHDVLMDSTVQAWDSTALEDTGPIGMVFGVPAPYVMDLRNFAEDITKWYTLYRRN